MQSRADPTATTQGKKARQPRQLKLATREALWAYVFLAIPLGFFLFLRIWPAFQSFWLSLFTWHVDPGAA